MPESTSGKVPVIACIRAAWTFFLENWRLFMPAAAIVAVVSQVGPLLAGLTASPNPPPQSALQAVFGDFLVYLPSIIAGLMFTAAILRKAVRDEFLAPTGLAAGADEIRLLGAGLAMACLFIPIGGLVMLVLWITVFSKIVTSEAAMQVLLNDPEAMNKAIIEALGDGGATALSLFLMLVLAIIIFLGARLYMINAATIGERRVVLFQTWSWSRGNVLRMIGAMILTVLPVMLIDNVVQTIAISFLAAIPEGSRFMPGLLASAVVSFAGAMTTIPVAALGVVFYKGLRPPEFAAK
ncbi:MAG: hypothetical protein QM773_14465 [Hyphomonadaceae bacterium]